MVSSYLDVGDNVHANVIGWLDSTCAGNKAWFIPGVCQDKGHRIAKVIVCGKEWCTVCGKMGSTAHNRRYVRWLPKIMQMESMRYFVFTIPDNIRYRYRDKRSLTVLGNRAQEMLKRHGIKRGLRRWHWFGDRSPHKYHPHLNVIVDGKYTDEKQLRSIKRGWSRILKTDVVSVNVKYKPTVKDMAGCLHYVTRSTFLDYSWDIDMAMELRNLRNMVVWGKYYWQDDPVWELDSTIREKAGEYIDIKAIENIIEHKCPKCGSHLEWGRALPGALLDISDKEYLGSGYYYLTKNDRDGPDGLPGVVKKRLEFIRLEFMAKVFYNVYFQPNRRLNSPFYGHN